MQMECEVRVYNMAPQLPLILFMILMLFFFFDFFVFLAKLNLKSIQFTHAEQ